MVDIKTIKAGDRVQQDYHDRRIGTVIKVFSPNGNPDGPMGVNYQLDGEDHEDSWDWPSSLILVESKLEQPKEQIMKISMDKQYRTRSGENVVIYTTDRKHNGGFTVVGGIVEGNGEHSVEYWRGDGRVLSSGVENRHDLIEYNPAQDLKLDQPIWVRNSPRGCWFPRHFASVDERGKVMCWDDGCTSFTVTEKYHKSAWDYWTATKPE